MRIKYILTVVVISIFMSGCSYLQVDGDMNSNPWDYYYVKKSYSTQFVSTFYHQQPNKITKSQYRISPPYIQNMYEKIDGDECDEIHCPQI